MPDNKKEWEIKLNRTHAFLIILIIVAASGIAFTAGNMLGREKENKNIPVVKKELKAAYNIGKRLREKEVSAQNKEKKGIKENELTFYKTLTADTPMTTIKKESADRKDSLKEKKTPSAKYSSYNLQHKKEVKKLRPSHISKEGKTVYTIQIAAFKSEQEAIAFRRKIEKKGYKPYIVTFVKDGTKWHRVRIGMVKKVQEARELARKIYHQEKIKALIIRLK